MRAFLEQSFPAFLGLTGNSENVAAAKAEFRVFAERKRDALEPDGYTVPHSATAFLIGADGTFLAHFPDTLDRKELARQLRAYVEAKGECS